MDINGKALQDMEEGFAMISIEDEEQGGLVYEKNLEDLSEIDIRWCLVGRFLTEASIDFQAMQHKMASLWRPGRGMYVKQLDPNRFIFQFYHDIDIKRVIEGSPWTFGRFHLVFERLKDGDNPRTVSINKMDIWVQLHGMNTGFMSQRVVKDVGNYIGIFIESDVNNFVGVWREYLRVRVSVPLDVPLKRRMKLKKSAENWCWVNFKYECIPNFCYICGMIGHGEKFCEKLFETSTEIVEKPYGSWMKADSRRKAHMMGSKWLRSGGTSQTASTAEEGGPGKGKVSDESGGKDISNYKKSGYVGERSGKLLVTVDGENQGKMLLTDKVTPNQLIKNHISINHGVENQFDNSEILLLDPKRRRIDQPISSGPTEVLTQEIDTIMDSEDCNEENQKNLLTAGAARQVRREL